MKGVSVLLILGICAGWGSAQFLNNRPFPTYSLENMPDTEFSCRDKILGGYYADADTQCQMFHICVKVAGVGIQDFRFLCPNGTAFDQDHQICAEWEDVDCDATTLYYSSDNFDLYRLGSGFESKARKYGEDEETFALQRAETGDARINHEHQSNSVNQKKEIKDNYYRPSQQRQSNYQNNQNTQNNERDIFKGSSSSNFFNNRNNGKERDEDYDDNVNVNQDRDYEQRRKVSRTKSRRPVQSRTQKNDYKKEDIENKDTDYNNQRTTSDNVEVQTRRSSRPTVYINNFAGSSYIPTTTKPSSTTINNEQYSNAVNNHRGRQGQRQRQQQYNDADNFRQTDTYTNSPTPSYSTSTPAPFRQTQQYNTPPNRQSTQTTNNDGKPFYTTNYPKKETENVPQQKSKQTTPFNDQYDISKVKSTKAETFPTTISQKYDVTKVKQTENYATKTTPFSKTENYPSNNPQYVDKKPTTPIRQTENYPTTLSTKPKPFSLSNQPSSNFPTTFAPRTNAGFTQIVKQTEQYNNKQSQNTQQFNTQKSTPQYTPTPFSQQTEQYNNKQSQNTQQFNTQKSTPQYTPTPFSQQYSSPTKSSTSKPTTFTQYSPTVPRITSTTPVSRSNRFDETQYDDGSYSSKYDYDNDKKEDEFLKTAHSQNIAASRNELAKTIKQQQSTLKPQYESPRPFSVSPNTPKVTNTPKITNTPKVTNTPVVTNTPKVASTSKTASTPNIPRSTQAQTPSTRNTQNPVETKNTAPQAPSPKKVKDASYDYAYYDSNPSSEPEYEIDTELKKSTVKN